MFIINPISGVGRKNIIPQLVDEILDNEHFEWEFQYTQYRFHGREISENQKSKFDAIVAVGGDGSVNEIGSALIDSKCALGILPCGSGNGAARHLGIPLKLKQAIQQISAFKPQKIDTGIVNEHAFIGTCGFGFDAHIAHQFDKFGKRGFLSYAKLVLRELKTYKPPLFIANNDSFSIKKEALMCSIANSAQFGNGFEISPKSSMQDAIFELVFLEKFPWYKSPELAIKFFKGKIDRSQHHTLINFDAPIYLKTENEENLLCHIDGEPITLKEPAKIKIKPLSLSIL